MLVLLAVPELLGRSLTVSYDYSLDTSQVPFFDSIRDPLDLTLCVGRVRIIYSKEGKHREKGNDLQRHRSSEGS